MTASIPAGQKALRTVALETNFHGDYTSRRSLIRMVAIYSTGIER